MMDKKEIETLDSLKDLFADEAEKIQLPESLSRANIEKMFAENYEASILSAGEKDSDEDKAEEKRGTIVRFRRVIGIAAAIAVVAGISFTVKAPFSQGSDVSIAVAAAEKVKEAVGSAKGIFNREETKPVVTEPETVRDEAAETVLNTPEETTKAESVMPEIFAEKEFTGIDGLVTCSGSYIYYPGNDGMDKIRVIRISPADGMKIQSDIVIDMKKEEQATYKGIYVEKDMVAVVAEKHGPSGNSVLVCTYNVSDHANPVCIRTTEIFGYYLESKLVSDKIVVAVKGVLDESSVFGYKEGGKDVKYDVSRESLTENNPDNSFILVAGLDTLSAMAPSSAFIKGSSASVTINSNGICITEYPAESSRTKVRYIPADFDSEKMAGAYIEGSATGRAYALKENRICVLVRNGESLSMKIYDIGGRNFTEFTPDNFFDFAPDAPAEFRCEDATGLVYSGGKVYMFGFDKETVSVVDIAPGEPVISLPGSGVISIGHNADGCAVVKMFNADGTLADSIVCEKGKEIHTNGIAVLENGKKIAVPIIDMDKKDSCYTIYDVAHGVIVEDGKFSCSDEFAPSAAVVNDRTFYAVYTGKIVAYSKDTGKQTGEISINGR